jgi:hypothetical protein
MATGGLFQRARFMAGLVLRIASRALPQRSRTPVATSLPDAETLIEALQTGDIAGLTACGAGLATARDSQGQSWFFIALEVAGLPTVQWFLDQGALATGTDRSGRTALEVIIQRDALRDEFDEAADDCPAILAALIDAGADVTAANSRGQTPLALAQALGATDMARRLVQAGA